MPDINLNIEQDFDRIKPEFAIGSARVVSFHGTPYLADGAPMNLIVTVRLENGDVYGLLGAVKESGGIGGEDDDGVYRFIPWPCAAVEVRDA